MQYIIYLLIIAILSIVLIRFVYLKVKSFRFVKSFQLIDDTLYKDKLPYTGVIKVTQIDANLYLDFDDGNLRGLTLNMKDGASVYWRDHYTYVTCYSKDGRQITQAKFEALYDRFVDANSLLNAYNESFTHAQLSI